MNTKQTTNFAIFVFALVGICLWISISAIRSSGPSPNPTQSSESVSNSVPTYSSSDPNLASKPMEVQLALIQSNGTVAANDPSIIAFASQLNTLTNLYPDTRNQIGDATASTQKILGDKGISETLTEIMDDMEQVLNRKTQNQTYADYITSYCMMRTKGMSREASVKSLRGMIHKLGIQ